MTGNTFIVFRIRGLGMAARIRGVFEVAWIATLTASALAAERVVAPGDPPSWTAEPGWLANPTAHVGVSPGAGSLVFRVAEPGRGMKWQRQLDEPISLAPYRHVTLRYRTRTAARRGDYLLAILGGPQGGPDGYRTPILPTEIRVDGRWHTAVGALGDGVESWIARGLAVQAQAAGEPAEIEIGEVRFLSEAPRRALAEALPYEKIDGSTAPAEGVRLLDISRLATTDASGLPQLLGFRDWFTANQVRASGVRFELTGNGRSTASTGLASSAGRLEIPVSGRAAAVALLVAARFDGDEEPAIGSGRLREIRDVDRLLFRLRYREGTPDEMLCLSEPTGTFSLTSGPQVAVLFADPVRELVLVEIVERSPQVDLHVLAATFLAPGASPFEKRRPRAARPKMRKLVASSLHDRAVSLDGSRITLRGGEIEAVVDLGDFTIERIWNGYRGAEVTLGRDSRLVRIVREDGAKVVLEASAGGLTISRDSPTRVRFVRALRDEQLDLELRGTVEVHRDEILWTSAVENRGSPVVLEQRSPELERLVVGDAATDELFFPKRGAVLTAQPCAYSRAASGLFPVQFVDLSSPRGGGLYVRTEDRVGLEKIYEASKGNDGARLGVRTTLRLETGTTGSMARTAIGVHGRDWHAAFDAYRRWLRGWYHPRKPLKPWFREIFNFRQRFLWFWDPLYDRESGRFRVDEALAEGREAFGGIEYLHLMDWGSHPEHGRVYGRTGDYAPWDAWKGGTKSFADALRSVDDEGVPVGLYVEGYLLEERGRLGQGAGRSWQILGPGGERRYWPGASEMFICPWVPAWQEIQADTYRRVVTMFPVRGVYIDQLGFADWGKSCWSREHGHAVPARPLRGERELTRAVSETLATLNPGIAVYTEETPCDLASSLQDGSFTYAMNEAQRTQTDVPLNIARFAFPSFKTFEILVCDRPTGSWATGVLWTFFNGEGIWLEGPAGDWFTPRTLAAIRRCHAILRAHRVAFTTLEPEPLVPTLARGIQAHRFPGKNETVYTLWNSLPITYRGPVLELGARHRARNVHDLWNDRPVEVRRREEGTLEADLELAPHGVGCIAVPHPSPASGPRR